MDAKFDAGALARAEQGRPLAGQIRFDGGGRVRAAQFDAQRLGTIMAAAQRQARIANVLASPLRCATLSLLSASPAMSVSDIATLTESTLALASYHLRQLEAEGLVSIRKAGREHHVRLNAEAFRSMIRSLGTLAAPD